MKSQEYIRDTLQAAKIYAICSKQEGLPKALIEAMACQLAVVATDVGECKNVLEKITIPVPAGDAKAFAEGLNALIENPDHREAMAVSCRARSMDYSWQNVSNIVEDTYDKITSCKMQLSIASKVLSGKIAQLILIAAVAYFSLGLIILLLFNFEAPTDYYRDIYIPKFYMVCFILNFLYVFPGYHFSDIFTPKAFSFKRL